MVAAAHDHLGALRELAGDHAGALAHFERALALRTKGLGPDHPVTLASIGQRADVLVTLNRCADARPDLTRAIAGFNKLVGNDDTKMPDFADTLSVLARCDLRDHHLDAALAGFQRALRIKENVHAPVVDQGALRWHVAQTVWALNRHDEAIASAERAATDLATQRESASSLAEVNRWLATHSRDAHH